MSQLQLNQESGVLHLLLSRPEKKNALSLAMYQAMADAINAASADTAVKVIVLSGEGGNFTSGNDLADFLQDPSVQEESPVYQFLMSLLHCEIPIIAAVEGFAIGIGSTLLLHCERVFAAENAIFSLPFINLGLVPEAGASLLLPRFVGYQQAAHWLLSGDKFSATEAHAAGFVGKVCAPNWALREALIYAHMLQQKPRSGLVATKKLLRRDDEPLPQRLQIELDLFVQHLSAPAAVEAMTAFMHKRAPDFSNL
jgi:enoyl-CoA hydratase/carnithine racemase